MAVYIEGPAGLQIDWEMLQVMIANFAAVSDDNDSIGVSVQKKAVSDSSPAHKDVFQGKLGPVIGEWNPEKTNRMIQEF